MARTVRMRCCNDEKITFIPPSAYEGQREIPKRNRCPRCKGLGLIEEKHETTRTLYKVCGSCNGGGKKRTAG
jgi:DnaJ-class molecular chaperone